MSLPKRNSSDTPRVVNEPWSGVHAVRDCFCGIGAAFFFFSFSRVGVSVLGKAMSPVHVKL